MNYSKYEIFETQFKKLQESDFICEQVWVLLHRAISNYNVLVADTFLYNDQTDPFTKTANIHFILLPINALNAVNFYLPSAFTLHVLLIRSCLLNGHSIILPSEIIESSEIKRWVIQKVTFILVSAIANLK